MSEDLRALIQRWRAAAECQRYDEDDMTASVLEVCADELEAALSAVRVVAPRPEPAPPDVWLKVIHAIAVEAMTAQSDPNAAAEHYRKALIGICKMALKAQDVLAVSPSPPAPTLDTLASRSPETDTTMSARAKEQPCADGGHVWSNRVSASWIPKVGTPCDCLRKTWRGSGAVRFVEALSSPASAPTEAPSHERRKFSQLIAEIMSPEAQERVRARTKELSALIAAQDTEKP